MDGTETEFAQQWGQWLRSKLKDKGWTGADLRRAIEAGGGKLGITQTSRWINGEQRPSVKGAAMVADALGLDRREVWTVAGRYEALNDDDGPIVVADDPAEWFVQRIKARRFPPNIEERLIREIRREIEQRQRAYSDILDTVQAAAVGPSDPDANV